MREWFAPSALILALCGLAFAQPRLAAQGSAGYASPQDARGALERAEADGRAAAARAQRLEAAASGAREAAAKTARERAALAARIQQSEAGLAAAEARQALLDDAQRAVRGRLAERQAPIARLTGALQKFARRPVAVAVLKPGSLREAVYLRAMLSSTVPLVRERTGDLRAELDRARALQREAAQAQQVLATREAELEQRQQRLARLETRQRLASREAGGAAARESDRALALAEEARDLDALVGEFERAGSLRAELAALPGPVLRPADPTQARASAEPAGPATPGAPSTYQLPGSGRILTGFGVRGADGLPSDGLVFAARPRAQLVAPAPGRIAFAGPYRGYGRIVIVEHGGGWTSLVTGLARIDVRVGERVLAGAPIGIAPPAGGAITLEARHEGEPVNPLLLVG